MEDMSESISDSSVDDDTDRYRNPPAPIGSRTKAVVTVKEEDDGGISALLENIALYTVKGVLDNVDSTELESLKYFHINTSSEEGDLSDTDDDDIKWNGATPVIEKEIKDTKEDNSIKPSCSKDTDFSEVSPERLNRLLALSEELSAKVKSRKKVKCESEKNIRNGPYKERSHSKGSNRSSEEERSHSKRRIRIEERHKHDRSHSKKTRRHKLKQMKNEYSDDSSSDESNFSSRKSERKYSTSVLPDEKNVRFSSAPDKKWSHHSPSPKRSQWHSSPSPSPERQDSHHPPSPRRSRWHSSPSPSVERQDSHHPPSPKRSRWNSSPSPSPERQDSHHPPSPKRSRWNSSPSPSPERQESHYFMESRKYSRTEREPSEPPPQHLFGSYHCELCKVTMTSQVTYDSHIAGKRHYKALKAKNAFENVPSSACTPEVQNKYPLPPPNVERIKVDEQARLQQIIEKQVKTPCPGLYNVTEIQGISETHYYCKMCNSPCSTNSIVPHLNGFKHMLRCLEYFSPAVYNRLKFKSKYEIEGEITERLAIIKRTEGIGKMAVEKEILVGSENGLYGRNDDFAEKLGIDSKLMTSGASPEFALLYRESCIPDKTKGGYHCRICEAHTNSKEMWESHINGKRHLTNVRKIPTGSAPSKLKSIPLPCARPFLKELLSNVDEPIVGLKYIRETQNLVTKTRVYQCNLCGACLTDGDIIDHLISQKHRIKYLEEINHPDLSILDSMSLQDHSTCSLIEGLCATMEMEQGRGHPQVFVAKNNFSLFDGR